MSGVVSWAIGKALSTGLSYLGGWQVKLALAAVVVAVGSYLWFDNKALNSQLKLDVQVEQTLKDSITSLKEREIETNKALQKQKDINDDLKEVFLKTQDERDNILDQLNNVPSLVPNSPNLSPVKRDLAQDSITKTPAVQIEINKLSDDQFRCNELVTGAKVQSFDKVNKVCPSLVGGK